MEDTVNNDLIAHDLIPPHRRAPIARNNPFPLRRGAPIAQAHAPKRSETVVQLTMFHQAAM